jgi:hypothetical protein
VVLTLPAGVISGGNVATTTAGTLSFVGSLVDLIDVPVGDSVDRRQNIAAYTFGGS